MKLGQHDVRMEDSESLAKALGIDDHTDDISTFLNGHGWSCDDPDARDELQTGLQTAIDVIRPYLSGKTSLDSKPVMGQGSVEISLNSKTKKVTVREMSRNDADYLWPRRRDTDAFIAFSIDGKKTFQEVLDTHTRCSTGFLCHRAKMLDHSTSPALQLSFVDSQNFDEDFNNSSAITPELERFRKCLPFEPDDTRMQRVIAEFATLASRAKDNSSYIVNLISEGQPLEEVRGDRAKSFFEDEWGSSHLVLHHGM